jgi:hypothetical protein
MLINNNGVSFEYINIYSLVDKRIGIPIFQRFYDWKEKQIIETLNDIENALSNPDKQIYLLDFIWYSEDGSMKLADGQQRLVSLNLLIKSINDYIDAKSLNISKVKLFDVHYDNFDYNTKYNNCFNNYVVAPFKKMYLKLYEFVSNHETELEKIIHVIKNQIFIYNKKTANADDAFAIFTQINTGGKPLTKDEVMKTTIDQYAKVYGVDVSTTAKELKNTINGYYKFKYNALNANFDTIAIMSFLKNDIVCSKESFKLFINYLNIVKGLGDASISYVIEYIHRSQLFDILNVMALKGIDIKVKKDYLFYVMFPLCLLSVSMSMKKSNPGGIILSLYSDVIASIKADKKPMDICEDIASFINENANMCKISFDLFKNSLGDKNLNSRIKEALLIMDVISHTTSSDLTMASIDLEHIYPQHPSTKWALEGWPTDTETRSQLINNIGNYLLLNGSVNKSIKNKYITDKIIEYKKIIPKDITLQTDLNTVDFDDFEKRKEEYIFERQTKIAETIRDEFVLGKVIITD